MYRYSKELDPVEIAPLLELDRNQVSKQLTKALATLRICISRQLGKEDK
jgi:hypothetical protein